MTTPDPGPAGSSNPQPPAAPTHIYKHPAGHGLGRHHAGRDLSARNAQPPEVATGLLAAAGMIGATPEQLARAEQFTSRTMADLDMADGTPVADVATFGPHDDGHEVEWADRHGDLRRTHVTDAVFAEFFQPIGAQS